MDGQEIQGDAADGEDLIDLPENVPGHISSEKLEAMLEEIAGFEVELVEDPTLPGYGARYLQQSVAKCRQFLNRTQYYLQVTKRYEKNLKRASRVYELDLELKVAGLLADDPEVRKQSAVDDRKALAVSMLKAEHEVLARFRVAVQELDDVIRLIKSRYDDLKHTNGDIRLQRQLVKDDKEGWLGGGEGYTPPQAGKDKSIPDGMAPPVRPEAIDPKDVLDDARRPDDLPVPKSPSHAQQIASFFSNKPVRSGTPVQPPPAPGADGRDEPGEDPGPVAGVSVSYADLLAD